jgi:hypothetical protein
MRRDRSASSRTPRAREGCCSCAFHLFVRSGSRRPPQVFVMEPTDAWHLHHLPWLGGGTLRGSGASLASG